MVRLQGSPTFTLAFRLTWPVMAGYLPMAVAFGLLFSDVSLTLFSAVWVYAGAAQFLSVRFFENFVLLSELWLATFFLNLRHVFYGFHMRSRFLKFPFWTRAYCIFALTDETYAVLCENSRKDPEEDATLCARVSFLNHATWIVGCGLGAVLKQNLPLQIKGLDFFLTGLFVVLLVEQIKDHRECKPVLLASGIGALGAYSGHPLWLFWAMGLCVAAGLFVFPGKTEEQTEGQS